MIKYVHENIFDLDVDARVNPVNCAGVMGKGLALQFKNKYPEMYEYYKNMCLSHIVKPYEVTYFKYMYMKAKPLWECNPDDEVTLNIDCIILFPTKDDWRDSSRSEYIYFGLINFVQTYEKQNIKSVAFPKLGCGCGGLDWKKEVKPIMEKFLNDLPIDVYICI